MEVTLNLFATLLQYMPHKATGSPCTIEVDEGTRVRDLLKELKIPPEKAKLVFLNGVHSKGDEILNEGDRVGVFPPVGGG